MVDLGVANTAKNKFGNHCRQKAAFMTVTVRFAPSPTGKLHVGNVRAALWNWLFARRENGRFILRIDDTDQERSTEAYENGIRADLGWLGLTWSETFRQSARFDRYDAVVERLKSEGRLYPCYETPDELERHRRLQRARGLPPVYDRAALSLTPDQIAAFENEGRKPHWRFKLSRETVTWSDIIRGETRVDTSSVSDPVLIRADGMYLYTLPSCIDDIDYDVTHVIRGEDHVTNTAVQAEIMQWLLENPDTPEKAVGSMPQFAHHSLLIGADGQGLSKRLGSLSIEAMRDSGLEPAAITSLLARLGTSEPVLPVRDLDQLADGFDLGQVGRAPARFDEADLIALNAKILHETPYAHVGERLSAWGVSENIWLLARGNIERLSDVREWKGIIEGEIDPVIEDPDFTSAACELVPNDPFTDESWGAFTVAVREKTGRKGKNLFMPLRLALTGKGHGPEMSDVFRLIGAEKARKRLSGHRG